MVRLEDCRLFSQLNQEELEKLPDLAEERAYSPGQEIFKEGAEGDGVYVVKDGLVEISALIAPGRRRVFSTISPGDIFGEMAVLDEQPRSATATALEATTVYFLPRRAFLDFMDRSPTTSRATLREISRRLRDFDRQYLREVSEAEGLALLGRFASSVVHDLRNPLHLIGLATETACIADSTPEVRRGSREIIRQQIGTIRELVEEILAISRGSVSEIELTPTSYPAFLHDLIREVRSAATLKSARLELQGPVPPVVVPINPQRLRRVFLNLLQNAAAAAPPGSPISFRCHLDGGVIVTEIEDAGPGIAPQIAARLFSAFATHGKPNGTGLGLFICKRIIDEHRGWISARSEPGRGATFSFGLPLFGRT